VITGWLVKVMIGIALLGVAAVEIGSPIITRAQVDGAAHDAADDAASEYFATRNIDRAREVAQKIADDEDAELQEFGLDEQGRIHVRLFKEARSIVLKKISQTKSWYEIRVSATGSGPTK
jgi:hypothetical protein